MCSDWSNWFPRPGQRPRVKRRSQGKRVIRPGNGLRDILSIYRVRNATPLSGTAGRTTVGTNRIYRFSDPFPAKGSTTPKTRQWGVRSYIYIICTIDVRVIPTVAALLCKGHNVHFYPETDSR